MRAGGYAVMSLNRMASTIKMTDARPMHKPRLCPRARRQAEQRLKKIQSEEIFPGVHIVSAEEHASTVEHAKYEVEHMHVGEYESHGQHKSEQLANELEAAMAHKLLTENPNYEQEEEQFMFPGVEKNTTGSSASYVRTGTQVPPGFGYSPKGESVFPGVAKDGVPTPPQGLSSLGGRLATPRSKRLRHTVKRVPSGRDEQPFVLDRQCSFNMGLKRTKSILGAEPEREGAKAWKEVYPGVWLPENSKAAPKIENVQHGTDEMQRVVVDAISEHVEEKHPEQVRHK